MVKSKHYGGLHTVFEQAGKLSATLMSCNKMFPSRWIRYSQRITAEDLDAIGILVSSSNLGRYHLYMPHCASTDAWKAQEGVPMTELVNSLYLEAEDALRLARQEGISAWSHRKGANPRYIYRIVERGKIPLHLLELFLDEGLEWFWEGTPLAEAYGNLIEIAGYHDVRK